MEVGFDAIPFFVKCVDLETAAVFLDALDFPAALDEQFSSFSCDCQDSRGPESQVARPVALAGAPTSRAAASAPAIKIYFIICSMGSGNKNCIRTFASQESLHLLHLAPPDGNPRSSRSPTEKVIDNNE